MKKRVALLLVAVMLFSLPIFLGNGTGIGATAKAQGNGQSKGIPQQAQELDKQVQKLDEQLNSMVINVMNPPAPLKAAKGDYNRETGEGTDDTEAIQGVIDYVINRGGGTIGLPSGHVFKTTSDLIISGTDPKGRANIVFEGLGDGYCYIYRDSVQGEDEDESAIIRISGTGYNLRLRNFFLEGDKNIDYGIYAGTSVAISSFSNFTIERVKNGIKLNASCWGTTFEDFIIREVENGFSNRGSTTSLFIKNGYVYHATGTAWRIVGGYSTLVNLMTDKCYGIPYDFYYADSVTATSLGCELSQVDNIINSTWSNVQIGNLRLNNNTVANSIIHNSTESTLNIGNVVTFGTKAPTQGDDVKLFDFSWAANSKTTVGKLVKLNVQPSHAEIATDKISRYSWENDRPTIPQAILEGQEMFFYKGEARFKTVQVVLSGISSERPVDNLHVGLQYFDTTLGKPIWCKDTSGVWVDSNGEIVE